MTAVVAAALIAFVCALVMPAAASAEEFTVNSVADEEDAAPGVGGCESAGGKCTLRAAIEEANGLEGEDRIFFEREEVFDGQITGTISLDTGLPPIVDPVSILGECVITEGLRPCVGVDGPGSSEPALIVKNAEAEIHGLAVTGAETGIEVTGSPRLRVSSNWLGVRLDGSAGGNGTGMLLGKGLENVRIGNEGESNVFANNSEDGLDIHGASGVRVMGGYFGVGPDGTTPAPNGEKDIEVVSFGNSGAIGNRIGTQLSPEATVTPACDGGCNVISGAGSLGIDLEGDGGEESPAAATVIAGNYIGLDATGTGAVPNGGGVSVGMAGQTVIGGVRASEANLFAGGQAAVVAGPAAANLVVRGNWVGFDAEGAAIAPPENGIVVNSEGLSSAAEVTITGNEIAVEDGIGIEQVGLGGWLAGNAISGAGVGIRTGGETEEHGNLIQSNLIEGSRESGILVESSFNEILGNEVFASGGAGILVEGKGLFFGFGVSQNLIGGDWEGDENLIAGSGGAAIEISNPEKATNEVARNRGSANGGPFIDLVAASPAIEPEGPNKGIDPPAFDFATRSGAGGFGAEPDARVRVFRKATGEAGEIESFLGEVFADEEGAWEVSYGALIPAGTQVAATQTGAGSGTSELAAATVPAEASGSGGARPCTIDCGPGTPAPPQPVPQTKIFKGSKGKRLVRATAAFRFGSTVAGAVFTCKLDGGPFKKCHSPQVYTGLKPGKHRFEVQAIGSVGQVDPTPAKLKFTVLG